MTVQPASPTASSSRTASCAPGGSANAVGFLADGSAVIGDPEVTVTLDYGGDTPLLVNYNKAMTTQNGVLLYSQDYDTRTKNTIEGYHVIVRPSARARRSCGSARH